jgi:hypothetical protein
MKVMSKHSLEQSESSTNMASSTSYQAAHAVFGTNELLCDIVGRLPLKDIVIITGICKTWRKAILDNLAIQQTLFLAPAAISDIASEMDCLSMRLEDMPPDQYTIVAEYHSYTKRLWICKKPKFIDPILTAFKPGLRPLGIWQNMFITQPPSKSVAITISRKGSRPRKNARPETAKWPDQPEQLELKCETGVKLGELHASCQSEIRKHTNSISLNIGFVPQGVTASRDIWVGGRWEVRNGEVVRQTQPRLIELSDDSSDSDDFSDFSDEMYEGNMGSRYYPGGDLDSDEEYQSDDYGINEYSSYGYFFR